MDLLESEESSDDDSEKLLNQRREKKKTSLTVNKKFASKFEAEGRFKDLQRAKELELDSADGVDSSDDEDSSESEDEEGDILNAHLELKILDTINSLRRKDPKIYDNSTKFFDPDHDEEDDGNDSAGSVDEEKVGKESKSKKKTYKTVLREQLLQDGAEGDDEGNEMNAVQRGKALRKSNIAYDDEQRGLRDSIIRDLHGGVDSQDDNDNESDDNGLVLKKRTSEDEDEEDRRMKEALKEMNDLGDASTSKEDRFLTDYLANKRWKDKTGFNDIINDGNDGNDTDDEKHLEEIDRFESKYNFRFEEAGGEDNPLNTQIVGHSRNIDNSFRKSDDRRKLERENRKERKEKERRQKEAELRRLKNVKRTEMLERLKKINDIGDAEFATEDFLDEEWDPQKYEAQMAAQFNDDYYEAAQGDEDMPLEHPGELEGWDDEDYEYDLEECGDENVSKDKKKRNKKKVDENVEEELYKLDYEDIVAGMPTRFKYRQVEPESFGLTAEDILLADDEDLNQYVSLKKLATYRTDGDRHAKNLDKKRKRLRVKLKEKKEELANQEAESVANSLKTKKSRRVKDTAEDEVVTSHKGGKKRRIRKNKNKSNDNHKRTGGISGKEGEIENDAKASKKRRDNLFDI